MMETKPIQLKSPMRNGSMTSILSTRELDNIFDVSCYPNRSCVRNRRFKVILEDNPVDNYLDSKKKLFNWTIFIHNKVNINIGKPEVSSQYIIRKYIDLYDIQA